MGNKKIFAVIDTNVLVSALISTDINSFPLRVMAGVYSGIITPVYNMEIIQEYEDVLRRDKFHLDCNDIESAIGVFEQLGLNLERRCLSNNGKHQTFSKQTICCNTKRDC